MLMLMLASESESVISTAAEKNDYDYDNPFASIAKTKIKSTHCFHLTKLFVLYYEIFIYRVTLTILFLYIGDFYGL